MGQGPEQNQPFVAGPDFAPDFLEVYHACCEYQNYNRDGNAQIGGPAPQLWGFVVIVHGIIVDWIRHMDVSDATLSAIECEGLKN